MSKAFSYKAILLQQKNKRIRQNCSNMKEKVIFTTALCLSAMTPMMAQNITGKVMNTKGEPLAFANVVLLNRTDSAFVKGAVSGEDGSIKVFGRGEPIIYINATLYNYRKLTVKSYKKSLLFRIIIVFLQHIY